MGIYKCSIDYYRVLRVGKLANRLQINAAYRAAALECHPDKHDHCLRAKERMQLVNIAKEILNDPSVKQQYDAARVQHKTKSGCQCKSWTEEADIWASKTGKVPGGSGDACHCENCDPETKARKEQERREQEEQKRRELERKERERKESEQRAKELKERLAREAIERKRIREIERKRKIRVSLEEEHQARQSAAKEQLERLIEGIRKRREQEQLSKQALQTDKRPPPSPLPQYSLYWTENGETTPLIQSLRDDFDSARWRHQEATAKVPSDCSQQVLHDYAEEVELRRAAMFEKAMAWAEATSIATRLRRNM